MFNTKNMRVNYPGSEKIYVPGEINKIQVGMRKINLHNSVVTGREGEMSEKRNNPVIVYDTSGPYSDPKITTDIEKGIPRIRTNWYGKRKDITEFTEKNLKSTTGFASIFPCRYIPLQAKEGKNITQMYYGKRRIITPEMEYVAIRENQQIEALGLKSYITPDFVRKEVASGRAIIPSNINHPESEPMIIGEKFLVKTNIFIGSENISSAIRQEIEKMVDCCYMGGDAITYSPTGDHINDVREWVLRNSPVPVGTIPIREALAKVAEIKDLTWAIYRDTLIEQAEQGVDIFTIHAGILRQHMDMALPRLAGIASYEGFIMEEWMRANKCENFLYTHFDEICDIAKQYDAVISLGSGYGPGCIYDANDEVQFAELRVKGQLTQMAWSQCVQVIIEGSGHVPMNKISENVKEQQYTCGKAPFYGLAPVTTDIALGYEHIPAAIGAAQMAWHGASMICCFPYKKTSDFTTQEIRMGAIANKIAAHAADVAKGHPGAQVRDNAMSKAICELRSQDQVNLSIVPEYMKRQKSHYLIHTKQWP